MSKEKAISQNNENDLSSSLDASSKKEGCKKKGGAKFLLVLIIILALGGVIVYLLSLLNSKKFFLVPESDQLIVKNGIFFVVGNEPYRPSEPELAGVYAPIKLPRDYYNVNIKEFDDLASLNAEFASILLDQAKVWLFGTNEKLYLKGKEYLQRVEKLKGLRQIQLTLIQGLNADVDYIEAKRACMGIENTLRDALTKFERAKHDGTHRFQDTDMWIEKVKMLLNAIRRVEKENNEQNEKISDIQAFSPNAGTLLQANDKA